MSADNWGICPKCYKDIELLVESSYGKVTSVEFVKLLEKFSDIKNKKHATLRENYDIWTNLDGTFSISYHCSCDRCGFKFKHKYNQNILEG